METNENASQALVSDEEVSFSLDATEQQLLEEFGVLSLCEYCYAAT